MKLLVSVLIVFINLFFTIGCSDVKNDITLPPVVGVHPEGFGDFRSPNFHKFIFRENNWNINLTNCQSCHAADYNGGITDLSCLGCHTQPAGPEACNTCHGQFSDPNFIAPPNDLEDNSDNASKGVGAHYKHVYNNSKSTNIGCFECHQITGVDENNKFVHAHISPPPAKMEFGEFSYSDSLGVNPEYNFTNLDCSNVYCHGGFKFSKSSSSNQWAYIEDFIVGNNYTPIWNSTTHLDGECGTCHGEIDSDGNLVTPLPTGHFGNYIITDCVNCHSSVVNGDGEIIDSSKHIDKLINYP